MSVLSQFSQLRFVPPKDDRTIKPLVLVIITTQIKNIISKCLIQN